MLDTLLSWLSNIPVELATVVLATLPVTELRAALPIAITAFELEPLSALMFSILGNIIPLILIFAFLPPMIRFAETRSPWLKRILDKYFRSLERKHKDQYLKYGPIVLLLFVAIPLPGSGVWTASVLSVLFDMKARRSVPIILSGLLISGFIVLFLTQGGVKFLGS